MGFVNQKLECLGLSVQSLDTQVGTFLGPHAGKRVSGIPETHCETGSEMSPPKISGPSLVGYAAGGHCQREPLETLGRDAVGSCEG